MNRLLFTQVSELARRSVLRTMRQPAMVFPSMIFPLFLLAVNSGGLRSAVRLPGFPTDSYLTFVLAVPFMQGTLFSIMNAGTDVANDVETGFLNRLALTPMRRLALIGGQLAGVVALGMVQATVYLVVGLAAGAHLAAGLGGALFIIGYSMLLAVGFGGLGVFAALRTGSGEAVQGLFPLFFVLLFMSSGSLPRPLIQQDWFRTVATWNPVSYIIEAIRSLFIVGWDSTALWRGLVVAVAIAAVSLTAATLSLRQRLVRT